MDAVSIGSPDLGTPAIGTPRVNMPAVGTPAIDTARVSAAVLELLRAIGEDPSRDGLVDTPERVAEAYAEFFGGVGVDAVSRLGEPIGAGQASGGLVMMGGIEFRSMCEHHLLPFFGTATIAYVADDKIVGLGRLPLLVDTIASRPQIQERLTHEIAEALERALDPAGVLVHVEARHDCVSARGSRQTGSTTVTMSARGSLSEPAARAEVVALIGASQRSSIEPGTAQSGTIQPGTAQSGTIQPGTGEPGTIQPGIIEPNIVQKTS